MDNRPKVGVCVIIIKDGKILLGKRKNAHGSGTWAYPGGHLEYGESWEACAKREVAEEVGISIKNIRFDTVTNDFFPEENNHYITIFMIADFESGEISNKEPDKCDGWQWCDWGKYPNPLFVPVVNHLKSGFNPLKT